MVAQSHKLYTTAILSIYPELEMLRPSNKLSLRPNGKSVVYRPPDAYQYLHQMPQKTVIKCANFYISSIIIYTSLLYLNSSYLLYFYVTAFIILWQLKLLNLFYGRLQIVW